MSNRSSRKWRKRHPIDYVAVRERKERASRLKRQLIAANARAKYGPLRRPSTIVVKSLETGEVLREEEPRRRNRDRYGYSPVLDQAAQRDGFASYYEYIHSPAWADLRARALDRDQHRCRLCGESKKPLQVHHDHYKDLLSLKALKTVCFKCHRWIHTKEKAA